ncbi:MAG: hypothetical protein ACM32E_09105, partial [Gemmatimonadota bacterium]
AAAAAAAAVTGVLTATAAISGPAARPGGPAGPPAALSHVPPYYVVLADLVESREAVVRASATGQVLATVRPPRPYGIFTFVTGAADDRTFVLAAQRWWPIARGNRGMAAEQRDNATPMVFFRLRIDPAAHTARLTRLRLPVVPAAPDLAGIGLSPDAGRLALALHQGSGPGTARGPAIEVVTLATGARRTWTWPGGGWIGNFKPLGQPLSWTADGRFLAFQQWGGRLDSTASVRILDTAAPGTSLRASKLVVSFYNRDSAPGVGDGNTLITPDGSSVIASTTTTAGSGQHYRTTLEIDRYSAATGHLTGWRARWHIAGWQDVLWTSRSGSTLIIIDARGKAGAGVTGVLDPAGFTPLPGAPAAIQIAW